MRVRTVALSVEPSRAEQSCDRSIRRIGAESIGRLSRCRGTQVHRVWPLLLDNVVFASTAKAHCLPAFSSPSSLSVHCSAAMQCNAVAAGRLAALRSLFEAVLPIHLVR